MPRLIHRVARAAIRVVPSLQRVPKLVSGLRRRFPATDERIEVDISTGGRMVINPRDYVSYHIYMLGLFEEETVRALLSYLQPGDTFFDIGGHFGQYTVAAGRKVGARGSVHVFEPGPVQTEYLTQNIAINGLEQVTHARLALSDAEGEFGLNVPSLYDIGKSQLVEAGKGTFTVRVTTLDNYCREHGIERIDVMKVDVEGAEYGVFKGAEDTLRRLAPRAIFYESVSSLCEPFGHAPDETHKLLEDAGYTIHVLVEGTPQAVESTRRSSYTDFVALR